MEEADVQYHAVSAADKHVAVSAMHQKSNKVRRCFKAAKTPLFILVSLALLALTVEAYFINRLYYLVPPVTPQTSNTTSGKDGPSLNSSCKPFAHLHGVNEDNQLHGWSETCGMDYKDGMLTVQKEGFYYVYSKVSFPDDFFFRHSVMFYSPSYPKNIPLMKTTKSSRKKGQPGLSSSYLGGVFNLCKGCHVFVKVNNTPITQNNTEDNFFGAFMI